MLDECVEFRERRTSTTSVTLSKRYNTKALFAARSLTSVSGHSPRPWCSLRFARFVKTRTLV
jgi:hypothetical protein